MIGRRRHLHDDRLFSCYVAERSGEAADAPSAGHLAACAECAARYVQLAQFMDGLRADAEAETDAIFTPDDLHAQQLHIQRRIEHLGHPARVLSFPARMVGRHLTTAGARIAPRWAAAAAAAGLFIGVGVGILLDARHRSTSAAPGAPGAPMTMTVARPSRVAAPIVAVSGPASVEAVVDPVDDDQFLSEIEAVLGGPRNQELLLFDLLTPRGQEISADIR